VLLKKQPALPVEEPELNEKYAESLDDIKRRYTETYLSRKKRPKWTSTHTSIVQVVGGAVVFCLIVVVLYRNFAGEETSQLSRTPLIQPDRRAVNTTNPASTPSAVPPAGSETKKQPQRKQQLKKQEENRPEENLYSDKKLSNAATIAEGNETTKNENKADKKEIISNAGNEPVDEVVKPKSRPININRLVKLSANNYKQRPFGGILNLELTIDNDSKFELDRVIVELRYLKPSEQPLKSERIVFSSISPNGSQTLKIPDFLRGVKVTYRVMEIESSQYERYTAGL
jgi:hypothetical protein